jgi:hypothetical protein
MAVAAIMVGVPLTINNVKLKAMNSKLASENNNLTYELGKQMVSQTPNNKEKVIKQKYERDQTMDRNTRIEAMKEKFRSPRKTDPQEEVIETRLDRPSRKPSAPTRGR